MNFESLDLDKLRQDNSFSTQKVLFPHQSEAIGALTKTFSFNDPKGKGGLLVLPTGAGKTFTAIKWLSENAIPKGAKILWLAHSFHLLDQACDEFINNAKWIPPPRSRLNIRVVSSNPSHSRASGILPTDDVVIMTTPTAIGNFFSEALDQAGKKLDTSFTKFLRGIKEQRLVLVLDEAHHAPAYGCRRLLSAIRAEHPSAYFLGLTATPGYSDETRRGWLNKLFDQWIIYEANKNKLQSQNILAREKLIQRKTNEVLEVDDALYNRLMREHRDLPEDIVEKLASNSLRNDFIIQEYLTNREEYGKTIIFADRWFQCVYLKEKLAKNGVRVDTVYSRIDADPGSAEARNRRTANDNHRIITQFKNGELDVLINVRMLTEGTDAPKTNTVFITRETTSSILLTQMIGRALRGEKAGGGPGKKDANIVFFTDTWRKIIQWASYSPGGGVAEDQPVKGYYPTEMISIRLVEELVQRINSGRTFQTTPFSYLMPIGWYQATYVSIGDGEEMGSFDEFVMAYNFQEMGFKAFIKRHLGSLNEEWQKENLSMDWALREVRQLAAGCFDLDKEDLGETLLFDLIRIARHMAQNRTPPRFFPFEERDRYDLDKLAKKFYLLNSLDQRVALEKEFRKAGSLWASFYKTFDRFKSAYDGALNRFVELSISGADHNTKLPEPSPLPDGGRIRELSEAEKNLVFTRDHFHCLCCGVTKGRGVKLQVDHILPDRMGGETSVNNSQTLCKFCNTTKGINEVNFTHQSSLLAVPKVLEIFGPTKYDDFRTFTQRTVNFFYHCGAVADCHRQKRATPKSGKELVIKLYPENDPDWLKPHCSRLLAALKDHFTYCESISAVVIEANGESVSDEFKLKATESEENPASSVTIDPDLEAKAKAGDTNAQVKLGCAYIERKELSDFKDAAHWFERAASKGNLDGHRELAMSLYFGAGIPRSLRKARDHFQAAAEKGDAEAQMWLAEMFLNGEGGKKNLDEYFKWMRRAAAQNSADALNAIGVDYHNGKVTPRDYSQAMKHYLKAAEYGSGRAMRNIGVLYEHGKGVPADSVTAVSWYQKGSALGDSGACCALALMHSKGCGVSKNLVEAYLIYSLAAEFADEGKERGAILASRTKLKKKMKPNEISKAEEALRDPDFYEKKKTALGEI